MDHDPYQNSHRLFVEIDKLIQNPIWILEGLRIAKTILKKNKVGRLKLRGIKIHYKATVIKTMRYDLLA